MSPTYSVCKKHGYLTGEQYTCPNCGEKTEVYSRITGYYRPVQNWNEGKIQEFKNRKLYDVENSKCRRISVTGNTAAETVEKTSCASDSSIMAENVLEGISKGIVRLPAEDRGEVGHQPLKYLFTTKTCPNCAKAKEMLSDEEYVLIDAEENAELTEQYSVMQAPTLIVVDGDEIERYVNASNIQRYVDAC